MLPLTLIIAEAALELAPQELWSHPAVAKHALRLRKKPQNLLLDRSFHHRAMLRLAQAEKRGRPDLVHMAILEADSTPLYTEGQLRIFVHTISDKAIEVAKGARLPRSYHRFEGLIAQLLLRSLTEGKPPLLRITDERFGELADELNPEPLIGLSRVGRPSSYKEVAGKLIDRKRPAFVVGGFPRGHFSNEATRRFDELYAIDTMPLDAHVVIARLLYEFEKEATMRGIRWRKGSLGVKHF